MYKVKRKLDLSDIKNLLQEQNIKCNRTNSKFQNLSFIDLLNALR